MKHRSARQQRFVYRNRGSVKVERSVKQYEQDRQHAERRAFEKFVALRRAALKQ